MSRPLTPDQIDQIRALRKLPQRTIAARVGVSLASVSKALKAPPPEPPRVAPAEPDPGDEVVIAEQLVAGGGSTEEELRASLVRLQKAGRVAEAEKDVARMVSVERVSMQIFSLLEKMKPPPVEDPATAPDMVEAARRFRERSTELLDRILAGVKR